MIKAVPIWRKRRKRNKKNLNKNLIKYTYKCALHDWLYNWLTLVISAQKNTWKLCGYCRHSGTQSIACSYKAVTGYLYPLERGFIFVHKPPVHIRFDEVESVNFARSAGNTRSFDFDISTMPGTTYTFVGIEKWVKYLVSFGFLWLVCCF